MKHHTYYVLVVKYMPQYCKFKDTEGNACEKQRNYGHEGEGTLYCKKHKKDGMIDLNSKRCIDNTDGKCIKIAVYNHDTEKYGRYCLKHKKEGMVNIKATKCSFLGCETTGVYYSPTDPNKKYCAVHKKSDMIHPRWCKFDGCKTLPSFSFPGETPIFCKMHKKDGMYDTASKKCSYEPCEVQACYNYDGLPPEYCKEHRMQGMINVNARLCQDCDVHASFNFPGEERCLYCTNHKKLGMIGIYFKECEKCIRVPVYNLPGLNEGKFCKLHKEGNMINVLVKKCKNPACVNGAWTSHYEGYCCQCFCDLFPNEGIVYNYKTKERAVMSMIKAEFQNMTPIYDKQVDSSCKYRPDCIIYLDIHAIMIEVDEYMHNRYDDEKEEDRISQLFKAINKKLVIIRFNPDHYYNENGNRIPSCWGYDVQGKAVIKDETEWKSRLDKLREEIEYCSKHKPTKDITTKYLYYDYENCTAPVGF